MLEQNLNIRPVTTINLHDFIQAFNVAYSDYFYPITLTPHSFEDLVESDAIRLDRSRAALIDGSVVGVGLLAERGRRGWIGGLGVVPAFRRQGIGRQLMFSLLTEARQLGLSSVQLEVILENDSAYSLYRSLGFETKRQLLVLVCSESCYDKSPESVAAWIEINEHNPIDLLPHLHHLPGVRRPWQRHFDSHRANLSLLSGLAAHSRTSSTLEGICIYAISGHSGRLLDLAAVDMDVGLTLLTHALSLYPTTNFHFNNVAENDPVLPALLTAGFREKLRQYEMILYLDQEPRS